MSRPGWTPDEALAANAEQGKIVARLFCGECRSPRCWATFAARVAGS